MLPKRWRWTVGVLALTLRGGIAFAQTAEPPPAAPVRMDGTVVEMAIVPEEGVVGDVRPWGGIQRLTGPGVGYRESFTTLEGFLPVYQPGLGLVFIDARGIFADTQVLGSNLGVGYRYYSPDADRIWGANVFWDVRDTGPHTFHQIGFGFESLGSRLDVRANGYIVAGTDQKETFFVFADPSFIGHNIQLARLGFGQGAMSGFDAEVGAPISCRLGLKAYVGTYNYQVADSPQAWGVRARLEERVTDNLDLNLAYSNDQVFGNSVTFAAGFRFGGRDSRRGSSRCDTFARRADRVERNYQITVADQVLATPQLAIDPATNQPIVVQHVASFAAAGGDGTVEHPFNTLANLQAGSGPNQILFAWANSTFTNETITLQTNQRFLGEGPACAHYFTATQGTFLLPRATPWLLQPVLTFTPGAPSDAITLANNTEVAGFVINNARRNAIAGTGVTGILVQCNTINNPLANGIFLNGTSAGIIDNNTIVYSLQSIGIAAGQLSNGVNLAGPFSGAVTNNTINYTLRNVGFTQAQSLNGILAQNTFAGSISGNNVTYDIANASVAGSTSVNGVFVNNTITGDVTNNVASLTLQNTGINNSSSGNGVSLSDVNGNVTGNRATLTLTNASISGGGVGNGVLVDGDITGSVSANTATRTLTNASVSGGASGNGVFVNGDVGADVVNNNAALTIQQGSISGGAAGNGVGVNGDVGGAVRGNGATVRLTNASITGGFAGNGVAVNDTVGADLERNTAALTLTSSSISGGAAGNAVIVNGDVGGNVTANNATLTLTNASTTGGATGNGVGVNGNTGGSATGNTVVIAGQFFSFNGGASGNGLLLNGDLGGDILNNRVTNTATNYTVSGGTDSGNGIFVNASSLNATISGNNVSGNTQNFGMQLQLSPTAATTAKALVSGNSFTNNNGAGPDFLANNNGAGDVGIILNANTASPVKGTNYSFTNTGTGSFTVQDNGNNTGGVTLGAGVTPGTVTFP